MIEPTIKMSLKKEEETIAAMNTKRQYCPIHNTNTHSLRDCREYKKQADYLKNKRNQFRNKYKQRFSRYSDNNRYSGHKPGINCEKYGHKKDQCWILHPELKKSYYERLNARKRSNFRKVNNNKGSKPGNAIFALEQIQEVLNQSQGCEENEKTDISSNNDELVEDQEETIKLLEQQENDTISSEEDDEAIEDEIYAIFADKDYNYQCPRRGY